MAYPLTLNEQMEARGQGRMAGLKCDDCGAVVFPAKAACPECGSRRLSPHQVEGEGVIRTFTVIRVAPTGFETPFIVAMAELAEGPWVVGRLVDHPVDQAGMDLIGRPVRLSFGEIQVERYGVDQCRIPLFNLAD